MRSQIARGLFVAWTLWMVLCCVGCSGAYGMPIVYDRVCARQAIPPRVAVPSDWLKDVKNRQDRAFLESRIAKVPRDRRRNDLDGAIQDAERGVIIERKGGE